MAPLSTNGSKKSCCALLKRCISSMKRTFALGEGKLLERGKTWPSGPERTFRSVCPSTAFMSSFPESTAESSWNSASSAFAYIRANVVLPLPGGPHNKKEKRCLPSIASRSGPPGRAGSPARAGLPFPTKCSWPINSSSVLGRIFDASGSFMALSIPFWYTMHI